MKIGLIDVDGHNFPNLALMKISAYHKRIGDNVSWYDMFSEYDIVYKSKVFTFTPDYEYEIRSNKVIIGGTGYNMDNDLFCDNEIPDYDIYSNCHWYKSGVSYGFLTRGCIRKCEWCVVPKKEGMLKPYMDIEYVAQNNKSVVLMDNNILASDYGIEQIKKIISLGLKVDFNQGIDARIIAENDYIAELLGKVKWLNQLRMACDTFGMMKYVKEATEKLRFYGAKPKEYFIYVLLRELEDSYDRINFCKANKLKAFAQPYRDFNNKNQVIPRWQKDMARYCNIKSIYESVDFKEYEPRKGFKCISYFS